MAPAQLLHHHREGSGTPVVLVHGIGATWQCWKPLIPALAARHNVIAPDMAGFGGSVALGVERPSLEHFARTTLELLDHLGIDRFHVVGNSMGGAIATELLKSGRVLSYTGISPAGQTHGPYLTVTKVLLRGAYYGSRLIAPIAPLLARVRPLRAAFLAQMLGKPWSVSPEYAVDLIRGCAVGRGFEPTLAHTLPGDRGIDAPPYDGPAQILWGTRDLILPLSAAARWVEKWHGDLEFVPLKKLGHVPMQDDPRLISDLILTLTRKTDAAQPASSAAA